jgi:hypothetical protein
VAGIERIPAAAEFGDLLHPRAGLDRIGPARIRDDGIRADFEAAGVTTQLQTLTNGLHKG